MRSLRARLLVTIGAAVLVATVLTVVVAGVLVRARVQDQALTNLERQADAVAAVAPVPAGQTRVVRAGARAPVRALRGGRPAGGRLDGLTGSGRVDGQLYAARTTPSGGRVVVVRPARLAAGDWRPFLVSLVLAGLGGAVVATLLALVLARRLTRPVRRLSDATRAVASGRADVRARPGRIEVADTGPGLEASDLPHAFDRFYLHDRYRTDRAVGSGLGLALVRELAEAMGGRVSVASSPGRGAAFAIDLQTSQPSAAATRSWSVMGSNGLGITPATPSDA